MYLNWHEQLYPLFVQTIFGAVGAIIFGYGGYLVYRDSVLHRMPNGFTIADVMAFTSYLWQLWDPLGRLIGFAATIQNSNAAAERVFAVLDRAPSVTERAGAAA